MRQRRRLVLHRRTLVQRRTQVKNSIRSIFSQQGLTELLPRGKKAWSKAGVAQLREQAKDLADCTIDDDLWRGRLHVELELLEAVSAQVAIVEKKLDELGAGDEQTQLLQSVPGVGPRLAEAVVCSLDDAKRFKSAAEVGGYAGLVPKLIESGTMSRVGRITRRGPSLLRGMLIEVAWVVWRKNAWAKLFVAKVSRGMKSRKKIAIVALARRLLVKLWAMLRTNTPWREFGPAAAAPTATAQAVT
jgi:transposase